jgi:hypothetical protein
MLGAVKTAQIVPYEEGVRECGPVATNMSGRLFEEWGTSMRGCYAE